MNGPARWKAPHATLQVRRQSCGRRPPPPTYLVTVPAHSAESPTDTQRRTERTSRVSEAGQQTPVRVCAPSACRSRGSQTTGAQAGARGTGEHTAEDTAPWLTGPPSTHPAHRLVPLAQPRLAWHSPRGQRALQEPQRHRKEQQSERRGGEGTDTQKQTHADMAIGVRQTEDIQWRKGGLSS